MAYDYETGIEIQIRPETLQNGLNHSTTHPNNGDVTSSIKGSNPELKQVLMGVDKAVMGPLLSKHPMQSAPTLDGKGHHQPPILAAGNIIPSLLVHGGKGGVVSGQPPVVPSLKTLKENGSLSYLAQQPNKLQNNNIVLTFPSMASAFKATKQGGILTNTATVSQRPSVADGGPPMHASTGSSQGMFVSESELRIQEEKVKLLRQQLKAAQSTV